MPSNRPSKEENYLEFAKNAGERSTCLRIHYGAVLVKNDRVIATGYNGAARGFANCDELGVCLREELHIPHGERYELCRSVHAEANAISQAHPDEAEGSTLYLYGVDNTGKCLSFAAPCEMCKRLIINAKIIDVVSYHDGKIVHTNPMEWAAQELTKVTDLLKSHIKK